MVDSSATNNFFLLREVKRLKLKINNSLTKIKVVNSGAMPVHGFYTVNMKVVVWSSDYSLMVVPLDDFYLMLDMDFFCMAGVTIMPHLRGVMIGVECAPCFVKAEDVTSSQKKGKGVLISAKQAYRGLKQGQHTYIASIKEIQEGTLGRTFQGIPELIGRVWRFDARRATQGITAQGSY